MRTLELPEGSLRVCTFLVWYVPPPLVHDEIPVWGNEQGADNVAHTSRARIRHRDEMDPQGSLVVPIRNKIHSP